MKKFLFNLIVFCVLGVLSASAQSMNKLKAGDISCMKSVSVDMPFYLENTDPKVVAVQFEVTVPQDVTINTSSATAQPEITRTVDHQVHISSLGNQRYRVMLMSPTNKPFRANKGKVLTLRTSVASAAALQVEETYPVTLSNVVIVDSLGNNVTTGYENGSITLEPCPDFTVSDIAITSGDVSPEGNVALSWTINNIGTRDSQGGWSEQITFISDDTGETLALTTMHYTDVLAAGQSVPRTANVAVPRIVGLDGAFHVQVKVVPNSDSGESVEYQNNNTAESAAAYNMLKKLYLALFRGDYITEDSNNPTYSCLLERSGSRKYAHTFELQKTAGDNRLVAPANITIGSGSSTAQFSLQMANDDILNGDTVTYSYSVLPANDYSSVAASIKVVDDEQPTITLTSSMEAINEGDGLNFDITLSAPSEQAVVVKLSCDRPERFPNMPTSVTIEPGVTVAHIAFAGYNDDVISLEEIVTFTASAKGHQQGSYLLKVYDDDMPTLSMKLSKYDVYENEGRKAILCTIERSGKLNPVVTLRLYDSPRDQLYYEPTTITLKKNQTKAEFYIGIRDDVENQGDRDVIFGAAVYVSSCSCTANVHQGGLVSAEIHITDNDGPHFSLSSAQSNLLEGSTTNEFTVGRNNTGEAVNAYITCSQPDLVTLPEYVTIPAGQREATFNVVVNTNEVQGDSHRVTFYAKDAPSGNYGQATCYAMITDQTLPDVAILDMSIVNADDIAVGDSIIVQTTVQNVGQDSLFLCTLAFRHGSLQEDHFVERFLKKGETLTQLDTIPAMGVAGNYKLKVTADPYNKITEIDKLNNSFEAEVIVKPLFTATAITDKNIYKNTETVQIHGKASGLHPYNADLDVYIINGGMRFLVQTTTDEQGNYTAEWTPEGNLAGHFIVGACTRDEGLQREMVTFEMYGMRRYDTGFILSELEVGETKDGYFDIINHGSLTLHNIEASVTNMSVNASITIDPVVRLRSGNHGRVYFHLEGHNVSPKPNEWETAIIHLESEEGAMYDQKIYFNIHSAVPSLKADVSSINTTMTPGYIREYPITLRNEGRQETGPITIDVSKLSWLKLGTPSTMASLKQGEETTVVLQLSPSSAMPFNSITTGQLAINYDSGNRGITIPFRIETVSQNTGTLVIDVWDEFTTGTQEAPHVEGATVSVLHPVTQQMLRQAVTGADGLATFELLNEGNYLVTVTHPKHSSWRETVMVDPSCTTTRRAFIEYSAVTVEMHYEKTEIEDEYNIVTTVTYETNVPKPVVLLDAPDKIILDEIETPYLYYAHLVNKGLVTAFDATYHVPSEVNGYRFTPLIDIPQDILPQQTISIPVEITKITDSEEEGAESSARATGPLHLPKPGQAPAASPRRSPEGAAACGIKQLANFFSACGGGGPGNSSESSISKAMQVADACGNGIGTGIMGGGGSGLLPSGPVFNADSGGGGETDDNTQSAPSIVSCDPYLADNGEAIIKDLAGIAWPPLGMAFSVLDALSGDPESLVTNVITSFLPAIVGLKQIDMLPYIDMELAGIGLYQATYKDNDSRQAGYTSFDEDDDLSTISGQGNDNENEDDDAARNGRRKITYVSIPKVMVDIEPARFRWKGIDGNEKEGTYLQMLRDYSKRKKTLWLAMERGRQRLGLTDKIDEPLFFNNLMFTEAKPTAEDIGSVENPEWFSSPMQAWSNRTVLGKYAAYHTSLLMHEIFGDWGFMFLDRDHLQAISDSLSLLWQTPDLGNTQTAVRRAVQGKLVTTIPAAFTMPYIHITGIYSMFSLNYNCPFSDWIDRFTNTLCRERGIDTYDDDNHIDTSRLQAMLDRIEQARPEINRAGYEDEAQMLITEDQQLLDYLSQPRSSVCSSVKLQIEQKMTMTREAVRGTLTVVNGSEQEAMTNVRLNLTVTDPDGNVADSHIMEITTESISGFTGEKDFTSGWTLDPKEKGIAKILFIPTRYAAPDEPVLYTFAGTISFTDPFTGQTMTRQLEVERLTVNPSPVLDLTYLMQRDIWGDDALTEEVEPIVPSQFTLLIHNKGKGDATKVKMLTNQPRIVENEKGLMVDFEIESSQLNGGAKTMALGQSVATDFGTIAAGTSTLAQWWLTSTLTGHFTDYDVQATHVTSYDNPDLSLLDQVTIHEMIHQIELTDVENTSDGTFAPENIAFLVNDEVDYHDAPDQLYTMDGGKTPVCEATDLRWQKASDTRYTLRVLPKTAGWCYGNTPDPTGGQQKIVAVRRSSDDAVLPVANFWQTDRTLVDKMEPIYENLIHFADEMPATGELYVIDFEPKPVVPLKLTVFEGIPDGNVFTRTPVGEVIVTFDRPINETTFTAADLSLKRAGTDLDVSGLTITKTGERSFRFDLSALTTLDGYYLLTVMMDGITDADGVAGADGRQIGWTQVEDGKANLIMVVEPEGAGTVTPGNTRQDFFGEVALTATPATGYLFDSWMEGDKQLSTSAAYTYTMFGEKTVRAVFTPQQFQQNVDWNPARGTVTGGGSGMYEYNTEVTWTAVPNDGYYFAGWRVGSMYADITLTDPTLSFTVTGQSYYFAVFEPLQYVNVDLSENNADNTSAFDNPYGKYFFVNSDRVLKSWQWNPVCFPFTISEQQINKLWGYATMIARLSSVDGEGMNFEYVYDIKAGVPYLVRPERTVNVPRFEFNGNNIYVAPVPETDSYGGYEFVGTYTPHEWDLDRGDGGQEYYYSPSQEKLYKAKSTTAALKGLRAYFVIPAGMLARLNIGGVFTDIEEVAPDAQVVRSDDHVYDLQGRKMKEDAGRMKDLAPGVYIVNGKKIVVK